MPKQEKDALLTELNKQIEKYNRTSKRKLFLDSIGGALTGNGGLGAAALGAGAGLAMATMGGTAEKIELENLEAELRSIKFKMMIKMGERGQEVSNLEVKLHNIESHINDLSEIISSKLYELNSIIMRASLPHPSMNAVPGALDFPYHFREHLYGRK